ncbi:unnamed protein product [Ambrosiozyma monospora]|uniref:Unnamed protein product n=1 Tax=Ambrosiozyma monospora TaxID=43982 RepID=A0ACB5U9V2_AMBMO|nr:unnamed protein product [Ambrosiozyma monospora]
MKEFLGDLTFREAYNRTGRILNITVSPASVFDQPTLLNYLTAPNVLIWSAVCASCSLPGVFPSSTIYEKQPPTGMIQEWSTQEIKFVDGSVNADLPITRLSEMFNVNHVIAVQVNPHVAPLLKMSIECVGGEVENEYSAKLKQLLHHGYNLVTTEAMHYLEVASELGIATNICTKLKQVLSQQYSGDITILPDIRLTELNKLLANPTPEFIWDCIVRGARATWPKVSIIKNHCSVEFSLDKSITAIRSRLISGSRRTFTHIPIALIEDIKQKNSMTDQQRQLLKQKHEDRRRSSSLNLEESFKWKSESFQFQQTKYSK